MLSFFQRVAIALSTGYIIVYFGEFMFWATPDREGMDLGGMAAVWVLYSIMAYPFLCVVSYFRVRDPWAVFLAGAFYGWFEEGLVVQTTYGTPNTPYPMSISFTALAWHAPIDVFVGWYLVRRVLAENRLRTTLALASGIGLFYGLWAIFWWNEPPEPMKVLLEEGRKDVVLVHFALFVFGTTAMLTVAYWLFQRVQIIEYKPSKVELWLLGTATLLYYALVTVPAAPRALWVLPPLLAVTFWALLNIRRVETLPDAIVAYPEPVQTRNYLMLLAIPVVASAVYFVALAVDLRLATNLVFFYVATPVGAIAWLVSVVMCGRGRNDQYAAEASDCERDDLNSRE
jgi:hypothetical protein